MKRRSKILAVSASVLALGMLSGITAVAAGAGPRHDALAPVIQATRKYHRLGAVIKAHYGLFTDVNGVTCINGTPRQGNMGYHYVNGDLVGDGKIDPEQPEAVLYEKTKSEMQLTAVEYIVTADAWKGAQPPELFGHPFMFIPAPNRFGLPDFYALHVWLWKDNPNGRFDPWNPKVRCPA